MSDERALREALEQAQGRVTELEAELAAERREHLEREAELEDAVETLEGYLQQEALARDELAAVVEKLHRSTRSKPLREPSLRVKTARW